MPKNGEERNNSKMVPAAQSPYRGLIRENVLAFLGSDPDIPEKGNLQI